MRRVAKSVWLGARTKLKWKKVKPLLQSELGIQSQMPMGAYASFMRSFPDLKIKNYQTTFSHADADGVVMLSLSRWVRRKKITAFGKRVSFSNLRSPSAVFKSRFILTRTIEPELNHPTNGKPVCVVTRLQGPGRKYVDAVELVREMNSQLGQPWQNYLLEQIIFHAKAQGVGAVAFLRPEHNPNLSYEVMEKIGVSKEEVDSMRSQAFATARKNKMKKVKGSKYFWIYF